MEHTALAGTGEVLALGMVALRVGCRIENSIKKGNGK